MILLEKEYSGESIIDLEGDAYSIINDESIPMDEDGFHTGTFKVTIEWFAN